MAEIDTRKLRKGVIRSRKSKKDRQHNNQMKMDRRTNNVCKALHRKLKTTSDTNPTKTGGELRCSGRVGMFYVCDTGDNS